MEMVLIDIIEDVIESIEDDNFDAYTYDGEKFHIIDNDNNINFQARLGQHNYYFKDNISGLVFMRTKKYLDERTTIQQMLIEENGEKCYYSYLDRDGNVKLVNIIRSDGNSSISCANNNVLDKTWEEIKEYADEVFEDYENFDDIVAEKLEIIEGQDTSDIEDKIIRDAFGEYGNPDMHGENGEYADAEYDENDEYGEEFDDDENGEDVQEKYKYEFNQIEENQRYGLSDLFENNSIQTYEHYVDEKEKNNDSTYSEENDMDFIEELYSQYTVKVNKREVDGTAKYRIIGDCEAALDQKTFDTVIFDNAVVRIKAVLDAVHEHNSIEKNNDLEK